MSSSKPAVLVVHNNTAHPARLRFRCDKHLLWDAWVAADGSVDVPDPGQACIAGQALFTDPGTAVRYTHPFELPLWCARLALSMVAREGLVRLQFDVDNSVPCGEIRLVNDTGAAVEFALHALHTPFAFSSRVAAYSAAELLLADITMTVTLDGITTEPVRPGTWAGHWTIHTSRLHSSAFPTFKRSQGGGWN